MKKLFLRILLTILIGMAIQMIFTQNAVKAYASTTTKYIAISGGSSHTVALKEDGSVIAWGNNKYGQCNVPEGLTNVKAITAGNDFTVALKNDGSVIAWGNNNMGQCNVPSGLMNVKAIAAGYYHAVALKEDGSVVAWGYNGYGECNIPSNLTNVKAITAGFDFTAAIKEDGNVIAWGGNELGQCNIPSGLTNVKAIAAGCSHIIALKEDGSVVAWGNNNFGQCNIPSGLTNVKAISAGYFHTIALKKDGSIAAWGNNVNGECNIPQNLTNVIAISSGYYYNIVLKDDGSIAAWGDNLDGECNAPTELANVRTMSPGFGFTAALKTDGNILAWGHNFYKQCNIPSGLTNVKEIAAGTNHILALKEDGSVAAWGDNYLKQCNIPTGLTNVKAIAAGVDHSAALREDGSVVAWGNNIHGQCNVPTGLTNVKAIAAGYDFTAALKEDGTVVAWGYNNYGQCNVPAGLTNVKAIAAGYDFTAALKEDGTVVAWGNNTHGQCNIPADLKNVKAVAAGYYHMAALKEDGTVAAWGDNSYGECKVPSNLTNVKSISAGGYNTAALKEDGGIVEFGEQNSFYPAENSTTEGPVVENPAVPGLQSLQATPEVKVELGGSIRVVDNIKISAILNDGSIKNGLEYLNNYLINDDPNLAGIIEMPGDGTIRGLKLGTTYIYFKYLGTYASIKVSVIKLVSLIVKPAAIKVELGGNIRIVDNIKISATFSDGSIKNGLEYLNNYSINDDPKLAGIIKMPGNGTICGLKTGTTYIYFKYLGTYANIKVTVIKLVSLAAKPMRVSVELGGSIRIVDNIKISGIYNDGSIKKGLEYLNNYSIDDDPKLAGIISIPGDGTIRGLKTGTTYIFFKYLKVYTKGIRIDVIKLQSLKASPAAISVQEGSSIKLSDIVKVTGTYSDGSSKIISQSKGIYSMPSNSYASIDKNGNVYGIKSGGSATANFVYNGKQCSILIKVTVNIAKKIVTTLKTLKPSADVAIYYPVIDGQTYRVYDLRHMSFDSNYDLINTGYCYVFLDYNWNLVKDPNILIKLDTIRKANYMFEQYYAYYVKHNNSWLTDMYNEQTKNYNGYIVSTGIMNVCQKLSSALITVGTGDITVKAAVKETLILAGKSYLEDAVKPDKLMSSVIVCIGYDRLQYVKALDQFYINQCIEKEDRILDYNKACEYIEDTDRAAGIINAIEARNIAAGIDEDSDPSTLLIDYWKDVFSDAIMDVKYKEISWLPATLSPEFIETCNTYLEEGDLTETTGQLAKVSWLFEDLHNSLQSCELHIKNDESGNCPNTINYKFIAPIKSSSSSGGGSTGSGGGW